MTRSRLRKILFIVAIAAFVIALVAIATPLVTSSAALSPDGGSVQRVTTILFGGIAAAAVFGIVLLLVEEIADRNDGPIRPSKRLRR